MGGLLFYWTSWMFWIVLTFLTKKCKKRTLLSAFLLIIIITSNIHITIDQTSISLAILILIISMLYKHAQNNQPLIHLFISFTIMIFYLATLVWEKITPVWIFLPRIILIPMICSLMISLLTKSFKSKIITSVLGLCLGEFIYSRLLTSYHLEATWGSLNLLDIIFTTIMFITIIEAIKVVQIKVYEVVHIYKRNYWLQKGKL